MTTFLLPADDGILRRFTRGGTVFYPHDGNHGDGAEDATVTVDANSRTMLSEKWGDAWLLLSVPRRMPGLHRFYLDHRGRMEYDLILHDKPRSAVFYWPIDFSPGMAFEFQPSLTAWEVARGNERPTDVVGSYAVYGPHSNNQYKTGKFCHVYRPLLRDARGEMAWARLHIDPDKKRLVIACPERWLTRAKYPVVLDPSVGYSSLGATKDDTDAYALAYDATAPGQNGDANAGTAFYGGSSDSGTLTVALAAYTGGGANPNGKSRLATTGGNAITLTTTAGFRSAAITWLGIVSATHYWISGWSNLSGVNTYYDSGSATGTFYNVKTSGPAAPADPYPTVDSGFNNRTSVYIDYSTPTKSLSVKQAVKRAANW